MFFMTFINTNANQFRDINIFFNQDLSEDRKTNEGDSEGNVLQNTEQSELKIQEEIELQRKYETKKISIEVIKNTIELFKWDLSQYSESSTLRDILHSEWVNFICDLQKKEPIEGQILTDIFKVIIMFYEIGRNRLIIRAPSL